MRNLGKLFYKEYFKEVDFNYLLQGRDAPDSEVKKIKEQNRDLTSSNLLHKIEKNSSANADFKLKISYPGLVTGVGINHEAKIEGEFKLGVHFDYTYGMPVVYGSSVKGVLRAWFMEFYEPKDNQPSKEELFEDIFEGETKGVAKSIYNRDIFFDAVLVKADRKGRILCSDSVTPHGGPERNNPLKNPTPITFLKIAPGCEMEFRFKLVDSVIDGKTFSAEQKKTLFEEIIKTVGVGAKTNVGYGQFTSTN